MESLFVLAGPIYLQIIVHKRGTFVTYIFRIVRRSFIHRLHLVLVVFFVAPIGMVCFTTLNGMHLCRSVHNLVYLKCCLKWAAY